MDINFIDYEVATRGAKKIIDYCDDLLSIANTKLPMARESVRSSWKGESSEHFLSKADTIENVLRTEAKRLNALATQIIKAANKLKEADQKFSSGGGKGGGGGGGGGF